MDEARLNNAVEALWLEETSSQSSKPNPRALTVVLHGELHPTDAWHRALPTLNGVRLWSLNVSVRGGMRVSEVHPLSAGVCRLLRSLVLAREQSTEFDARSAIGAWATAELAAQADAQACEVGDAESHLCTTLPYELAAIRTHVEPLLASISREAKLDCGIDVAYADGLLIVQPAVPDSPAPTTHAHTHAPTSTHAHTRERARTHTAVWSVRVFARA
jgi:hypothetical protein